MQLVQDEKTQPRRGIYLLPNLFTTAGLFAGFYAVIAAIKGSFELAAISLFIAILMDGLDGRVARLTGTQSAFGAQYDSLSDMACFGFVPAVVIYQWALKDLGKFGWLVAFIYVAATSLRLARFNLHGHTDRRFFIGLSCTSAAAVMAGMLWVGIDSAWDVSNLKLMIALVTLSSAILMVSNVRYHSFKDVNFKGHVSFMSVLTVVFVYALIAFDPPKVLWIMAVLYAISGPLFWLKGWIWRAKKG
jgi:CDP-diacylglycerol--serine O-phosphatidyltransferase